MRPPASQHQYAFLQPCSVLISLLASSAVQPVFKTTGSRPSASQHKQQLKRLQFVASYAEYWWGKVCNVYMAGRQLAPGNLSPSINFMEDKFVAMTLPFFMAVQQQSFEALCQMDAKVCFSVIQGPESKPYRGLCWSHG